MLQTNNTYITVNGLAPSTFYAVSVRYVNNAGASNSSVLNFQTDENGTYSMYYVILQDYNTLNPEGMS